MNEKLYLIIILISFIFYSCSDSRVQVYTYQGDSHQLKIDQYRGFCNIDTSSYEMCAVNSAIFGMHEQSLWCATHRESTPLSYQDKAFLLKGDSLNIDDVLNEIDKKIEILQNGTIKQQLITLKKILKTDFSPDKIFENAVFIDARDYILEESGKYDVVLINEAHYSTQNRMFTKSLLKPLFQKHGFKYLALEGLSWKDSLIQKRGYPIYETGFYTDDPVFGNLIREAIRLGYTLVPYETRNNNRGSVRDNDQASNIIAQTFDIDENAKVLIHAGYSHINECCIEGAYTPMGAKMKSKLGRDVFTINQTSMLGLNDTIKENEFYRYIANRVGVQFQKPIVTLGADHQPILSPLSIDNCDVEVYHPRMKLYRGRPSWLKDDRTYYKIPKEILAWKGNLINFIPFGESLNAVPVDNFAIEPSVSMLLYPGKYVANIIDCDSRVVKQFIMEVN